MADGVPCVIPGGKIFETDRLAETVTSAKGEDINAWYSGKKHRPGANVQAVMLPGGLPAWTGPAEPGHVRDITAARARALPALYRPAKPEKEAAPQEGHCLRRNQAVGGCGVTPEQRRLRAQLAANTRWSRPMSREDQADAARAAIRQRLKRVVDPLRQLPSHRPAAVGGGPRRAHKVGSTSSVPYAVDCTYQYVHWHHGFPRTPGRDDERAPVGARIRRHQPA